MISIVIPSRNNEKRIGRTLAGIFAQNRRDFEVLSCDDNSADRTPAILDYYPEIRRFRMPEGEHLPGEILNRVLPECRGDIVVVNHADACPLDADYLNELLKPLGAPGTAAAFAQQESRPDAPFEVWCDTMRRFSSGTPEFSFAGAAVRRELFDRIPVGASLPLAVAPEWARRAEEAGARIVYAPAARIEYSGRSTGATCGTGTVFSAAAGPSHWANCFRSGAFCAVFSATRSRTCVRSATAAATPPCPASCRGGSCNITLITAAIALPPEMKEKHHAENRSNSKTVRLR
ncbi:MAG: glycosyltransferase family 2 protein [Victivallis sp.]